MANAHGNGKIRGMKTNSIILSALFVVLIGGTGYWFSTREASTSPAPPGDAYQATSTPQVTVPNPASSTPTTTTKITKPTTNQKIMNATLHTSMGDITIEFSPTGTPNTVANFIKLAQSGFYDGTKFHRVIKGFMDQGGDPLTKDDAKEAQWGTGGPGYKFNDEITANNKNDAGTIAMANSGPNTAGSQFFINAVSNQFLNPNYTVFGRVTAGMDVVTAINNTPTDSSDRPLTPVVLKSITLK